MARNSSRHPQCFARYKQLTWMILELFSSSASLQIELSSLFLFRFVNARSFSRQRLHFLKGRPVVAQFPWIVKCKGTFLPPLASAAGLRLLPSTKVIFGSNTIGWPDNTALPYKWRRRQLAKSNNCLIWISLLELTSLSVNLHVT